MKKLFIAVLSLMAMFCQIASMAQSPFYRNNQLEIDKVKRQLSASCIAFGSPRDIAEKKVTADKKLISFLNEFYNKDWSVEETAKQLTSFSKKNWKFKTTDLGGLMKYETKIISTGNLTCSIAFAVFQNDIVFKKIYFQTISETSCVSPRHDMPGTQDANYLDIICVPLMNFPATVCAACGPAQSDKTDDAKLKNYKGQTYKIINTDSTAVNAMVWNRVDTYKTDSVEPEVFTLTNNHNTFMLYQLLYSPNHIMAINAMEALAFLQATHVVNLPPGYKEKMEAIKTSPVQINWQDGNASKSGVTYSEMPASDEKIIAKFSRH